MTPPNRSVTPKALSMIPYVLLLLRQDITLTSSAVSRSNQSHAPEEAREGETQRWVEQELEC